MGQSPEDELRESGIQRPAWSVMVGEFDPEKRINGQLLGMIYDTTWSYLPPTAALRRQEQAKELVLRSFELCGLQSLAAITNVDESIEVYADYNAQQALIESTAVLDIGRDSKSGYSSPSPVMNMLRLLMDKSVEVEVIYIEDVVIRNKDRWLIEGDTRRLAEAIIRALYQQELLATEEV